MSEQITIALQKAAVKLAESLTYGSAAKELNISETDLRSQIAELEGFLSIEVFRVYGQHVQVTDAGRLFIDACRSFLAKRHQD